MSDSGRSGEATTPSEDTTSPRPVRVPKTNLKRLSGSCDTCRRRKVKCDSQKNQGAPCTNCRAHNIPCTHNMPVQKPGIKNYSRQVNVLQQRVNELEDLLKKSQDQQKPRTSLISDPVAEITARHEHVDVDDQSDSEYTQMLNDMKKFSIASTDGGTNDRFFGPSSNVYFIRQMLSLKGGAGPSGRPWSVHSWEADTMKRPLLMFPEEDLMYNLIDIFFTNIPNYLAAIHEPTFRREVACGLHHLNSSFGGVVLMVCGVASRVSRDTRVLLDGASEHSAGWKWVSQTLELHTSLFESANLYDIQYCCLLSEYMLGSSTPQSTWFTIGQGMRYAVELGLHRRRGDGKPTVQGELRKRIFWTIFILDRHISIYHGRPVSLPDDAYDVEYPILCDDEYWETGNPATDFKQPVGKPSRMEAFVALIKLTQITSISLRSVFGIRTMKEASSIQSNLTLLDSMLNSWFNSVPAHLRWDTTSQPKAFFDQASELYMTYYNLQIFIHRPFVHSNSPLALPSLAICTNAARSCIRLLMIRHKLRPVLSMVTNMAAFSAGGSIIMNMWRGVREAPPREPAQRDIDDLSHCLNALRSISSRFHMCGHLVHGLEAFAEGLPLGESQQSQPCHDMQKIAEDDVEMPFGAWVPSGYVSDLQLHDVTLDFCGPSSFGVMPEEKAELENTGMWGGVTQADMALFNAAGWMSTAENTSSKAFSSDWNDQWSGYMASPPFFLKSDDGGFL